MNKEGGRQVAFKKACRLGQGSHALMTSASPGGPRSYHAGRAGLKPAK